MLSREVMKAAEHSRRLYGTKGQPYFEGDEGCLCVREMSDHILAHREDYDAEGKPLEVDEGFCRELGFTLYEADEWHLNVGLRHCIVVLLDGESPKVSLLESGAGGWESICVPAKTRPQLRALIEAMGR